MGLEVVPIDLHRLTSVAAARDVFRAERAGAAVVLPDDDLFFEYLNKIIPAADELRIPTLFPKRELVWAGAFMSFGADSSDIVRRSTNHIIKIVNGANPGELPMEHPTQVELVLNKTKADRYGMALPRAAILRAAQVYTK
jgi:putative ABC transport system substrate-binding protein